MSESNQDANDKKTEELPDAYTSTASLPRGDKPTMRMAAVVVGLAIAVTVIAQYFAPHFDHQNANLIGLASCAIAALFALYSLHRLDRWGGSPYRIPVATLVAVLLFFISFRLEGFNGEMLPLFRWRFSGAAERELKDVVAEADVATGDSVPNDSPDEATDGTSGGATDSGPSEADLLSESPQFLGPNRTGVYRSRAFSVPRDPNEIQVMWDHGIGEGWSSFSVADDLAMTLEQRGEQECLSCYRLEDGELAWIQQHKGLHQNPLGGIGPRSTPTIVGQRVYATTPTGLLWCVQRNTGEVIWTFDVLEHAGWDQATFETAAPWGYACSPLVVDGLCVVSLGGPDAGSDGRSLIALDADSGQVVWKSGTDQLSYASPIVTTLDGVRQIVSVNEKTVSGHKIADGELLWEFEWPGSTNTGANCSTAVPVGTSRLLVGKGYGGGSALVEMSHVDSQWSTKDVWRSQRVLKTKFNHTCVDRDVGYAISNGSLQAVNLIDATAYWTQPRRWRSGQGQVVLVDDVLVVQDEQGDVVFVRAAIDDYDELLRVPALDSKTWNIPTVAGRYVLVRNDRQAICFKLPPR